MLDLNLLSFYTQIYLMTVTHVAYADDNSRTFVKT